MHFKAHKKFDGSIDLLEFFLTAILRLTACNTRDKRFDSKGTLFQSKGKTLKICKIELAWQVLPLFMRPTGQIKLAYETGLMFCFRYGLGDGELEVSFRVFDIKLSSYLIF